MSSKKNILIIDDDPVVLRLLYGVLENNNYDVRTANNGLEGLKKISEKDPDLIVLDINMPVMGGLEFFEKISFSGGESRYPVYVLTARENFERLFKEFDIVGFMTKPFNIDTLLSDFEGILNFRKPVVSIVEKNDTSKPKSICIVEDDPTVYQSMILDFINAGYMVSSAKNGTNAVERITNDLPDLVLIKTGLDDIPGDLVIHRLKKMSKTLNVQYVLYTPRTGRLDENILKGLAKKCDLDNVLQYEESSDILEFVSQKY